MRHVIESDAGRLAEHLAWIRRLERQGEVTEGEADELCDFARKKYSDKRTFRTI
jgi:hypothetical protein